MKYKWKRPLAWMMSAALVFSIPGISVYADDTGTDIISPFSTIWDGTTSLSGGSYEVASDITITGEITISNNTTVTVADGMKISVADGAVLNVISSQIQGSVSVSGTLNVDQSFVDSVVTAVPTSIDITNYSTVNKIDVTTFMSNLYVTGGAKVGEISANVRFGNIYIQSADTVVSKLSMKAGTVSVSQGATLTEAILAPTGTTTTTKGKITNQGNIGSVTVNGYGVVNNYDNGIIDTVTIATQGPGEKGYDNLSNYSNGQINTVLVQSGSLSNGTVAAGTGTIENLIVEGGTAKNTNGTIEYVTISDGTLLNGATGSDPVTITELNVKGGIVTNESTGTISTLNLYAGSVSNNGAVTTLNKTAGSTGTFSGTEAGSTVENSVKISFGKIANGSVIVKKDTEDISNGQYLPSGTELTVQAVAADGYKLKDGSLQQNGTEIINGKFTLGTTDVEITAEFISLDTVQNWDGSNNLSTGIYEVTEPLVITEPVVIPAGVEIRLGTGGSLTVGTNGVITNDGELKIPVTVTANGSVTNNADGIIHEIESAVGGVVDNNGEMKSVVVSGGKVNNYGQVDKTVVNAGTFYVCGKDAAAQTVTLNNGTVDCFGNGKIISLEMFNGQAWSTDGARIESVTVNGGTLRCEKHYTTDIPGGLGSVTANAGYIHIGEGCTVDTVTIPEGKTPVIKNDGTITNTNGKLIVGYVISNPTLSSSNATPSAVTISWEPIQAKMLDGTLVATNEEDVTYHVIRGTESFEGMSVEDISTYPDVPGKFLSATSYRAELPVGTLEQSHYFCVVAILNGDISQKWAYNQLLVNLPKEETEKIYITPENTTVAKGSNRQFYVYGEDNSVLPGGVNWTVTGQKSQNTYISSSGLLTVGSDETATNLTVTVISKEDNRSTAEASVKVIANVGKLYTVTVNGGDGSGSYPAGSQVTIMAKAESGKKFSYWMAEGITLTQTQKVQNPLTITVPEADVVLTAYYVDIDTDDGWYPRPPYIPDYPVFIPGHSGSSSVDSSEDESVNGWIQDEKGNWSYLVEDKPVTDWQKIDNTWYYFNQDGIMQTGWLLDGNTWYYLKDWGGMATGWMYIDGYWYYFKDWGGMVTGWQYIDGVWYYFYSSGVMAANAWVQTSGYWYYLTGSGAMATARWVEWKGDWYYLYSSGIMATNATIDDYYVNSNGVWVQ